ncbi:succinate-semialdehyde dehydrogenase (NADP(+)), partial [Burkholderia sp. Ac-20353]|nr:succinate-semialdehyde dehydrogenase (NADP(+)) [Burkholderia sp. Ac-20353]
MPLSLSRPELIRSANLIDGAWRDAADGRRYAVADPATLDRVADAPDSSAVDARAAT